MTTFAIKFVDYMSEPKRIAIVGGGPSALFIYKELVNHAIKGTEVSIYEKTNQLGAGMPYSKQGALKEHITNVSDNEIPELPVSVADWVKKAPNELLIPWNMEDVEINEYKVLPRLLFGEYLSAQFKALIVKAQKKGIRTSIHYNSLVTDVRDELKNNLATVLLEDGSGTSYDHVILCTGHSWPKKEEQNIRGWFDSPYPPSKLAHPMNCAVAIRGASLTAIDAVRTLALNHGKFEKTDDGVYEYRPNKDSAGFHMVLHSLHGMLPAVRFHLEDSHLQPVPLLATEEALEIMKENGGFVPLDYIFERHFLKVLREQDKDFYELVKYDTIEAFVERMMELRERLDGFTLLQAEYKEAAKSIARHQSVVWKETLGALSYAMNYPAKYFSAEDMLRLRKTLMPLVSIVIAYVPQSSCRELLALYRAGVLSLIAVDAESKVYPREEGGCRYLYNEEEGGRQVVHEYDVFIDATGQSPIAFNDFPFPSLREQQCVSRAYVRFREAERGQKEMDRRNDGIVKDQSGNYLLQLPGVMINDNFQPLDGYGFASERIYIMAVPLIAGINPDYSGLDFCEQAAARVIESLYPER